MALLQSEPKRPKTQTYGGHDVRDILSQIGECLQSMGYQRALKTLEEEAAENAAGMDIEGWVTVDDKSPFTRLTDMWSWVKQSTSLTSLSFPSLDNALDDNDGSGSAEAGALPEPTTHAKLKLVEVEAQRDDASSSDSSSGSESESKALAQAGQKRKREITPESSDESSSDSESDSDDAMKEDRGSKVDSGSESDSSSSDDSDSRPSKRARTTKDDKKSVSDNSSRDSDTSSSNSGSSSSKKRSAKDSSKSSSSDSSSDSESSASNKSSSSSSSSSDRSSSSSSSDSSTGSSSDSSSDSDSESSKSPSPKRKTEKQVKKQKKTPKTKSTLKVPKVERTGSAASSSSATLEATSPIRPKVEKATDTLLIQDENAETKEIPATKENIKKLKKEQVSFSRIPADTKVDPKFSSNAYVPYDYANRAYQDLSVTKGKGFTKEKNKKKRGKTIPRKSAEQRDWERQARRDLSIESSPPPEASLTEDYNPFGFKNDTWDFMSGCGFNPMSGGFDGW